MRIKTYLAVAVVMVVAASGCSEPPVREPVRPVRTITAGKLTSANGRQFPGRAEAQQTVELSFQVSGPLVSLPVDVGAQVKKGDVIATIDQREFDAAVASAKANLEQAKATLLAMEKARPEEIAQLNAALDQAVAKQKQAVAEHDRNVQLIANNAVTQSSLDFSQARVELSDAEVKSAKEALAIGVAGARPEEKDAKRAEIQALEAAVATAELKLEYSTLKAPFDGEVSARYVDNFQTVQAKQSIYRLVDASTIEITVQIPETLIVQVPQGKQVSCQFDAFPGREFTGTVIKIGREASATTRTYPVTVEIDQPDDVRILPGMAAMIRSFFPEATVESEVLIVPPSSIFTATEGPQTYVWVVAGTKVTRREVKIGDMTSAGLIIAEGLQAGDIVVTAGVDFLREGQEVKLL